MMGPILGRNYNLLNSRGMKLGAFSALASAVMDQEQVSFHDGKVSNTPMSINDLSKKKDQDMAYKSLYEDKDIKDFMKKFSGKIKEESIKPIK